MLRELLGGMWGKGGGLISLKFLLKSHWNVDIRKWKCFSNSASGKMLLLMCVFWTPIHSRLLESIKVFEVKVSTPSQTHTQILTHTSHQSAVQNKHKVVNINQSKMPRMESWIDRNLVESSACFMLFNKCSEEQ